MAFAPAPRDIGEHGQDRQFIVVIPKNKWIVPEQEQTKCDDNCASSDCAEEISPLINTDFHRCRKKNLLIVIQSAFIFGWKLFFLQNLRFSLSHDEYLLLDAMRARGRKQSFRGLVQRLKPEAKSPVMHRYQSFGAKFEESFHGFFRIHVNFATGWCLISADRKQGDVDLVALADLLESRKVSAVAAVENRAAIHRDDKSTKVTMQVREKSRTPVMTRRE